jgi:hypothetical protein
LRPLDLATAALTSKKLRLDWAGPRPEGLRNETLLPLVWTALRARWPEPPGNSQDERVTLRLVSAAGTRCCLAWEAVFDFDFAGMIDKTETHSGEFDIDLIAPS